MEGVHDPDVIVLTESNFDTVVNQEKLILVEFYAPWCGHCKHLAPEYAKAATRLLKEDPPIKLGKVDATIESALASRFGVQGYPTLKVFRNGVASEYGGPRDEAGIVKYMKGQSGDSAKLLSSSDDLSKFQKFEDDLGVVGYFSSTEAAKKFLSVADKLREQFRFAIVKDSGIIATQNGGKDGIVIYRAVQGEEPKTSYSGSLSSESDIESFIWKNSVPLAGEISGDNSDRYQRSGLPRLTVYTTVDGSRDPSGRKYYLNRLRKVAKNYVGKMNFVMANRASGAFASEYQAFGFSDEKAAVSVIDATGGKFKGFSGKFSPEDVEIFVKDFLAGKVEKHLKSEPVPTSQGPVKVIVGKNFDEEVTNTDKDVFIEFYAPWCGHCKSLAPKWDKLGEELKGVETLTIAKIDATANDYPSTFDVKGFPTIYLLKANDKKNPIPYNGGREVNDMKAWLKKNANFGSKSDL